MNTDPTEKKIVKFLDLKKLNLTLQKEFIEGLENILDHGQYISGPKCDEFESQFSNLCGTRYTIGVGNGLDALELILKSLHIGPGDEVIVPSHTFIATWLAVTNVGAKPIPVNVDLETYNICPKKLLKALTPNTKALIGVHLYGRVFCVPEIKKFCADHNIFLIEDAAQAHGASYKEHQAGSIGIAAAFSFYPGKNLGALGDGGAITTNSPELAQTAREISNYGSTQRYQHLRIGTNSRLDSIQAAFLTKKLPYLKQWNKRREEIAIRYIAGLSGLDNLELPQMTLGHVWHLFVCRYPWRDELIKLLFKKDIYCQIHYPIAIADQQAFEGLTYHSGYDIESDRSLASNVISIPIDPMLDDKSVEFIIKNVVESVNLLNVINK